MKSERKPSPERTPHATPRLPTRSNPRRNRSNSHQPTKHPGKIRLPVVQHAERQCSQHLSTIPCQPAHPRRSRHPRASSPPLSLPFTRLRSSRVLRTIRARHSSLRPSHECAKQGVAQHWYCLGRQCRGEARSEVGGERQCIHSFKDHA